jgi:hypothetical protein
MDIRRWLLAAGIVRPKGAPPLMSNRWLAFFSLGAIVIGFLMLLTEHPASEARRGWVGVAVGAVGGLIAFYQHRKSRSRPER